MLKLNESRRVSRFPKKWRAGFAFIVGLMLAPVLTASADVTLTYSNVFSFDLTTTSTGVIEASVGGANYLYGTINTTSRSYGGAIYRVSPNGGAPQTIYQLKETDGYYPDAPLLLAQDPADGVQYLYGTTDYWPRSSSSLTVGSGTIFRVTLDGSNFQTLHVFAPFDSSGTGVNADGARPSYQLTDGGDGYLYGVTRQGGANTTGTIYRIKLDGSDFQVLHTFPAVDSAGNNTDGAYPSASLTIGPGGRLYGVTSNGGANKWIESSSTTNNVTSYVTTGAGVIFSLNVDGTDFQTIYNFTELDSTGTNRNGDGAIPKGKLLFDEQSGQLIGTASIGGEPADDSTKLGYGTVFSVQTDGTPDGTTLMTLHSFTGTDGSAPFGSLVAATDGLIYGVAGNGTNSSTTPYSAYGVVYSIDTLGNFNLAHGFTTGEVSSLTGGIIQGADSYFYGSGAYYGSCTYYGAVYRLSLNGVTTSSPYASCTDLTSSGGGSMSSGWLWLLCALGLAPPVRRRLFGFG